MTTDPGALYEFSVEPITTVDELEKRLSEPSPQLIESMQSLDGDILILGVGGKVGPTLAQTAVNAVKASGVARKVIGVDYFPDQKQRDRLNALGVETVQANLMEEGAFEKLPDAANVMYMVGRKFGSTGAEWQTWTTNVLLAGLAGRRYRDSRIVAFSSGNIYPFLPLISGGATEATPTAPLGEYSMSCLGRERMLDHAANDLGAKVLQFRLNYAAELRYGILLDVATQVWNETPISLTMGHVNVVWQGYVSNVALQCFALADSPARVLNITGPEIVSIRWMAQRFGEIFGKEPVFEGEESPNALLSNAAQCFRLFGYPQVSVDALLEWVACWVMSGGGTLGKPTHYETRDGKF